MTSPSAQLAQEIIDQLITEKILLPEDRKALILKLAEGKLQAEDWKLALEKKLDEGGGHDK